VCDNQPLQEVALWHDGLRARDFTTTQRGGSIVVSVEVLRGMRKSQFSQSWVMRKSVEWKSCCCSCWGYRRCKRTQRCFDLSKIWEKSQHKLGKNLSKFCPYEWNYIYFFLSS